MSLEPQTTNTTSVSQGNAERKQTWSERIVDWERSGLSQKQFCETQSLSYCRFLYWRRKLRPTAELIADSGSDTASFVPVALAPGLNNGMLSIVLPGGIEIRQICADNLALARELVRIL